MFDLGIIFRTTDLDKADVHHLWDKERLGGPELCTQALESILGQIT